MSTDRWGADQSLVLRAGRPWRHGSAADVIVQAGRIQSIGGPSPDDAEVIDIAGCIVLPGLVEAHCHLDKTLTGGPWIPHSAGDDLADRIRNDRERRSELGLPRPDGVRALLEQMVAFGTSHVRTHTDVDPEVGLRGIEVVGGVADEMRHQVSVEQVAFPQHGILTNPGTEALLDQALRQGATVIGSVDPEGMDGDAVRHLDIVFGLADKHGATIDIHLHDEGSLGLGELELICERTAALSMQGRVVVSHAYALGEADAAMQARVAEKLAAAGVAIITCAVYDFPVAPLKALGTAGATVACGHDGIRDLWGPYGSGDMLERAMHVAYRNTFRRDEDIELALAAATFGGATVLGLADYGLTEGCVADLVAVPAETAAEAVVCHPDRALVIKNGAVLQR